MTSWHDVLDGMEPGHDPLEWSIGIPRGAVISVRSAYLGVMRPATALSIVSLILIVKAVLIGWVTWGRAQMLGVETAAGRAGLTIASVALAIGLACAVAGAVLRHRDRGEDA